MAGGLVLAVLTFVLQRDPEAIALDASAANWGNRHATEFTTGVLDVFTDLGKPITIAVLAVVLAVEETIRTRSRWVAPFLLLVVAGNGILTTTIKHLADRVRPEINPVAETLGPSFPSGHSSWSAAFFAAAALLLARGRGRRACSVLAGTAAGLAVAIAASRVLLGVHWLSDVIAGLALGWAWFAACAIAFGGRLLRFGAPAEPVAASPSDDHSAGSGKRAPAAIVSPSPTAARRPTSVSSPSAPPTRASAPTSTRSSRIARSTTAPARTTLPGRRIEPRTTAPGSTTAPRPTTLVSTSPPTRAPGASSALATRAPVSRRAGERWSVAWVRIGQSGSSRSIGGSSVSSSWWLSQYASTVPTSRQ